MNKNIYYINLTGGIAGDMFSAAILDCMPHLAPSCLKFLQEFASDYCEVELDEYTDGVLSGKQFKVSEIHQPDHHHHEDVDEDPHSGHVHSHSHGRWSDIRNRIIGSGMPNSIQKHAIGIFTILAEAEASVHGVDVDSVTFHEVGAWDSIVDIMSAAYLVDQLGAVNWVSSPLPLCQGEIVSAHGVIPLPAPATAHILKGYPFKADSESGERVTPTGAAIFRYLSPSFDMPKELVHLENVGYGFGRRKLKDRSNVLRLTSYSTNDPKNTSYFSLEFAGKISFEIDDQTPEDLSIALGKISIFPAVLDVHQLSCIGKKGRLATSVKILCNEAGIDDVIELVFRETSTIGLRYETITRAVLRREEYETNSGAPLKEVWRPDGSSKKLESDYLERMDKTYRGRKLLRAELENDYDDA